MFSLENFPKVSEVIVTYNSKKYIDYAIQSIKNRNIKNGY